MLIFSHTRGINAQRLWKPRRRGIEKHFSGLDQKLLYPVPRPSQGFDAKAGGWLNSEARALSASDETRANGVEIDCIPPDVDMQIRRMGEKFLRELVRTVCNEANTIFVPYYIK